MADDILSILSNSYKSVATGIDNITNGERLTKDGYLSMSGNWSTDNKQTREAQNELLKAYKEQEEVLKNIRHLHKETSNDIRNLAAKNYLFQSSEEEKLAKRQLDNFKNLYNYANDKYRQQYKMLNEEESNIYKTALDNKRKLTEDELKRIKEIEKVRLETEERVKQEQEKNNNKWVTGLKSGFQTVLKHAAEMANNLTNIMYLDQIKTGYENMTQQYESNFTELAGRFGTNRSQTHNLINDAILTVNNDSTLLRGLNFANEVMPMITQAAQSGFLGEEAIEIGITNAIDKKIMPWLNTSSETWSYIQFNMTESAINEIKGQQLLLQETREGNRILQSGIADTLLNQFAPLLSSIELNTTSAEDLGEFYAIAQAQLGEGAPEEMIKATAKSMYNAVYKPFESITTGKPVDILRAQGFIQTGTVTGMEDFLYNMIAPQLSSIGDNRIGIGAYANVMGMDLYAHTQSAWNQYLTSDSESSKYLSETTDLEKIYNDTATSIVDKVTATQAHDNKIQNEYAEKILEHLETPHGSDVQKAILDEVYSIKRWLITSVAVQGINKGIDLLTKNLKIGNTGGINPSTTPGSGGAPIAGTISKGTVWGASIVGGIAGAGYGIYDTYQDSSNYKTAMLSGTENVQDTEAYERYKKELEDKHSSRMTGAITGGIIGGAAGAVGGGFAGVKIGTAIGTTIAPGVGTAVGAVVGGLIGLVGGFLGAKAGDVIGDEIHDGMSEGMAAFSEVLSDASVESLNSISLLQTNWDTEILERQNLVTAMKEATDEESKRRLLLDAGFDRNTVALAKSSEALDQLAISALNAAEDNSELANATENIIIDANNNASAAMFDQLWGKLKDGKTGEERRVGLKQVLGMLDVDSETYKRIEGDIDDSWWGGTSDEDVQTILKDIMREADVDEQKAIAGKYKLNYDTLNDVYVNQLTQAIATKNKDAAIDAIKMLKLDTLTNGADSTTNALEEIKKNEDIVMQLASMGIDIFQYKLGSSYIPYDQLALVHAGERVLTAGQNKEYTNELTSGNSTSSIIQAGVQDIVIAIKTQTADIINYLSTMSFNNSSFGNSQLNMLPAMGNTKVTI